VRTGGALGAELEIALQLPDRATRRTRRDLYEQLKIAIHTGRLAPGLRMPASRDLAMRLGLSRNTITTVYELLVSEGRLQARPGSGTFVAAGHAADPRPAPQADMAARIRADWRAWRPPALPPRARHQFFLGLPDFTSFPWEVWRKLVNRVLRQYGRGPLRPTPPQGSPDLRQAIASHLSSARGIACRAEDIIVTAGAQQAFDILARVLVHRPGVVVAVEDPGYAPIRRALQAAGGTVVGVPVDDDGILVGAVPPDAEVICVTPSHQFPLGVPMSPARRRALLDHVRQTGAIVIEDDYDGEFRFDGRPLEALQTLDTSGQVIYVGTFSKSLFPGLRLGYVVAPEWARNPLLAAKQISGPAPSTAQIALAAFITEGHLGRHVRRMRRIYGERRQALFEAVGEAPAGWLEPFPSAAGLHLSLRLPPGVDPARVLELAAELGVGAYSLAQFAEDPIGQNGLVLGYGGLGVDEVRLGAAALVQAVRRAANG
jgi:GntR family transcriptional regulator/MocR family aminotransferase